MSFAKKLGASLLAIGSVGMVGVAHADQVPGSMYAGGSLGRSFNKLDSDLKTVPPGYVQNNDLNTWGIKGFGGYNIDKSWSVEAGFAHLGRPTFSTKGPAGTVTGSASLASLYVAAIFSAPVAEDVSIFGKAGLAVNRAAEKGSSVIGAVTTTGSDTGAKIRPMLGAGVSYDLNKQVALRTELEYFGKMGKDSGIKSTLLSIGAVYKF